LVSVITPVSLDHVAVLGDTIELIAAEKAGIVKPGVPVVASPQKPEAMKVIQKKSDEQQSKLTRSDSAITLRREIDLGLDGKNLELELNNQSANIHLQLLGDHQVDNAQTAIAAIGQLNKTDFPTDLSQIASGINQVEWPARNQLVSVKPILIFVDGAHNDSSAIALRKSIEKLFPDRENVIVILGTIRGHDPSVVARELAPLRPIFITTESRHPKSLTKSELSDALGDSKITVTATTASTHEALEQAKFLAKKNDLILGTGSLFVAAEIVELEHGIEPELYPDTKLPVSPTNKPLQ
ncbi:MAG: Mur ligase family protein, partial [Dehalococcoidia bacterium]|nr:Mur ligase family protein [Dehalococcoidia bacterium]